MKTKKFFMTSLLVMGMIIAKAANGFPPELVLVSQPVLTYNANSVTIYYDVQNIGDYTYRGDLYIYLDPDDGHCYAREYMRICPGRIKRIAVSIPAYRPNPSWTYTVMPYYELGDELYSFTTFEYFEPVRFCWYGYHNEPWVVIHVGPRPRHYHRPSPYRFYYDGYRPIMPPPPGGYPPGFFDGRPPLDPHHHTYHHHHNYGGYPANYHPEHETPGYNIGSGSNGAAVVRPGNGTSGSSSYRATPVTPNNNSNNNNSGVTTRPSTNNSNNNNSGVTTRPSTNSSSNNNSGTTTRPSSNSSSNNNSGVTTRPSTNSSSNNNSGTTTRPSSNSSSSSGRSGTSSSSSSSSGRSGRSNNSSSSSRSSNTSSSNSSSRSSGTTGGGR